MEGSNKRKGCFTSKVCSAFSHSATQPFSSIALNYRVAVFEERMGAVKRQVGSDSLLLGHNFLFWAFFVAIEPQFSWSCSVLGLSFCTAQFQEARRK